MNGMSGHFEDSFFLAVCDFVYGVRFFATTLLLFSVGSSGLDELD